MLRSLKGDEKLRLFSQILLNDMKEIFLEDFELVKADYIFELFEIYKKNEDNFTEFIMKLKEFSIESYNIFKKSDSLKEIFCEKKVDFLFFLRKLSNEFYILYKKIEDIQLIYEIWNSFFNIYISIKDNCYNNNNDVVYMVKKQTFEWLNLFQSKYSPTQITPYEHIFGDHLGEMIAYFGNINLYNMQGLERLNGITTGHYFNSTNRRQNYLNQLINKRNRLEISNFENSNSLISWEFDLKFYFVIQQLKEKFLNK